MNHLADGSAPKTEYTIRFDDPDPNTHDVVLIVKGQKFYCVKMTLAKHSPGFYNMFYLDARLVGLREIAYKGPTDAAEFDSFLKIIHGVPELNDNVIGGVLELAVRSECGVARQHCVHFLNTSSTMSYKKKFELAQKFDLMDVKKKIINNCKTCGSLHKLMPKDLMELDKTTMGLFLQRNLALQGFPGRYIPRMNPRLRGRSPDYRHRESSTSTSSNTSSSSSSSFDSSSSSSESSSSPISSDEN